MTTLPVDRDMLAYLNGLAPLAPPDFATWPLERQRDGWEALCRATQARRPAGLLVEDLDVAGTHVRVYRPPGESPMPGVIYAHGGGWTMGSCETHDDICAEIADQADVVVVSYDYRLAPEHRPPAQLEDGLKVLDWMRSSGRAIGLDPTHVVGAGDSVGGQMTAGLALALRDRRLAQLRGLVLIYPALGADTGTRSYVEQANAPGLSSAEMAECLEAFLGPRGAGRWSDPYAVPNTAADVSGLPPTFITVAAHDPLHDDGTIFHARLKAAGIAVALREEAALAHSYMRARHASPVAMDGFRAIVEAIRHLAHEGMLPG